MACHDNPTQIQTLCSLSQECCLSSSQPLRVLLQIPFGIAPLDHVVSQLVPFGTRRSLFRAYPKLVYCCDFQSSKLRKHSEVGLGLTYNVAALRLLGLVNLRLKKQLLLKPPPLGGGD